MKNKIQFLVILSMIIIFNYCKEKEPEIPPTLSLKTGAGYTSADATVSPDTAITVGIIAVKTEDDLKTYNVSVAFDGASTTTTVEDFIIDSADKAYYEKDMTFNVRNQAGTEKYFFTITDIDGNIIQESLTFMVE